MLQIQHCSFSIFPVLHPHKPSFAPSNLSFYKSAKTLRPVKAHKLRPAPPEPWLAQAAQDDPTTATADSPPTEEGPIELPSSAPAIFASSDDPTPIQTATSVLLTGVITVFLFRALRRRAKRAKELRFRSSGEKKTLKEEAIESLKAITPTPIDAKAPPSPVQALLGGLTAGVIAIILYKFTTTIESTLSRQTLSDNFSVRQITITIRTIVNGVCYLATFVFGLNSLGLVLYSGQLALNSFSGDSTSQETKNERETPPGSDALDSSEGNNSKDDITSDSSK